MQQIGMSIKKWVTAFVVAFCIIGIVFLVIYALVSSLTLNGLRLLATTLIILLLTVPLAAYYLGASHVTAYKSGAVMTKDLMVGTIQKVHAQPATPAQTPVPYQSAYSIHRIDDPQRAEQIAGLLAGGGES